MFQWIANLFKKSECSCNGGRPIEPADPVNRPIPPTNQQRHQEALAYKRLLMLRQEQARLDAMREGIVRNSYAPIRIRPVPVVVTSAYSSVGHRGLDDYPVLFPILLDSSAGYGSDTPSTDSTNSSSCDTVTSDYSSSCDTGSFSGGDSGGGGSNDNY